jgi:hypothetical protein
MLLKFLNLTGKTISLRNAKTNKSKELVGTEGVNLFDCSLKTDDLHEFNCLSKYLVVQVVEGTSVIEEPVWACIIPIPIPTANVQVTYATIGYSANKGSVIANYNCTSPEADVIHPDESIEVSPEYLKFKFLMIGLGQYIIDSVGKVSDIKEDIYMTVEKPDSAEIVKDIKDEKTVVSAKVIKVQDIDNFMGAQPLLTTSETFQLGVIVMAIIIVCAAIILLVFSELRTHINDIISSKRGISSET